MRRAYQRECQTEQANPIADVRTVTVDRRSKYLKRFERLSGFKESLSSESCELCQLASRPGCQCRIRSLFFRRSNLVQPIADSTRGSDDLRVGRIADVDESDLIVLAVAAASNVLFTILEPVRADDVRVTQRLREVVLIGMGVH